jgi:AcrR family transcriptional regulator
MPKASADNPKPSERWALPAQQARSRATRERLLEAAEKVFAEKGYEGARMADIAEEAGCAVGSVYFRFKDKDALFFAIAEDFTQQVRAKMTSMTPGGDPATIVRNSVKQTAANFREHRGLFRAIMERGFEIPNLTATFFAFRDEAAAAFEQRLRDAGVKRRDLSLSVRVMTQMVYGFLLTAILNSRAPNKVDDDAAVEEMTKACLAYLGV